MNAKKMKLFLLICFILIIAGNLVAQTPSVASLTVTSGSAIKWYSASTGGTLYIGTEALVNGQHYYASQTVNGVESTTRLDVTATVTSCITAPTITTTAVTNIGSTTATLNGNITAINGANVTTRGFKYSTTNGFDPASAGTNISENGSYGNGTFSLSPSGLTTVTTYYLVAYAINSAGTTYGSQVVFNTLIQTDYAYTGGQQTFVVPAGITSVTIQAWGAQGGISGGYGGYATGTLSVSQGQTLYLYVGEQGGTLTGGFNGGGSGGCELICGSGISGGGGGGASDVRSGSNGLGNRVLVAAGGGGYAGNGAGAGGGSTGDDAPVYNTGFGGHGGTQVAGGTAGSYARNATDGGWGYGGNGSTGYNAWGGGGGGGGYYGGGGGTSTQDHGSGYSDGGGGGSSYTGGVTLGSTTANQQTGNGRILISY